MTPEEQFEDDMRYEAHLEALELKEEYATEEDYWPSPEQVYGINGLC